MEEIYHFIGMMDASPESRSNRGGTFILLRDSDLNVALVYGPGPHDDSFVEDAASTLARSPLRRWCYQDPPAGLEPPGWFERECEFADCGWFVPLVKRLAVGERVPVREIGAAYAANRGGRIMPRGTIQELFDAPSRDKAWLLGIIPKGAVENYDRVGWMLTYLPDGSVYRPDAPLVELCDPDGAGAVGELATWLAHIPCDLRQEGKQMLKVPRRPGWFLRLCDETGCGWFAPIAERLAAGEKVAPQTVLAAAAGGGARLLQDTRGAIRGQIRFQQQRAQAKKS